MIKQLFNRLKSISIQSRASIVYTIASLVTKGLSFITLPIFTRLLSTSEMGVTTTFTSWYTILYSVVTLSIAQGSVNVAFMEFRDNRNSYQSSVLALSTISSLFFFGIFVVNVPFWSDFFALPESVCYLLFISFMFTPATDMWMARQRYEYKYKAVVTVTISSAILSAGFSIFSVILAKSKGIVELGTIKLFSQYTITIGVAVILYCLMIYKGRTFYDKKYWSFALKLSLPLIIHSLAKHIMDVSDRTMIAKMVGSSEAGIYGVLQNVSMASLILWTAINNSLIPYMFEQLKEGKQKDISKVVQPLIAIYGVFALVLTLISPELIKILATEEYLQAIYIMPTITLL